MAVDEPPRRCDGGLVVKTIQLDYTDGTVV
jgi:hypothetical protein